jgi:hypothetical protein
MIKNNGEDSVQGIFASLAAINWYLVSLVLA